MTKSLDLTVSPNASEGNRRTERTTDVRMRLIGEVCHDIRRMRSLTLRSGLRRVYVKSYVGLRLSPLIRGSLVRRHTHRKSD